MDLRDITPSTTHTTNNLNQRLLDAHTNVPVTIKLVSIQDGMVQPLKITPETTFPSRTTTVQAASTLGDIFNVLQQDTGIRAGLHLMELTIEDIIGVHVSVYQNQMGRMMTRAMWGEDGPDVKARVWDWFLVQGVIPAHEHLNTGHGPVIEVKMRIRK